jgi:YD repeat-containing protein
MPGISYRFHHWIYRGNAWLDNYHELNYQMTQYGYDALNNLTDVWDAANNHTQMGYDKLARKTSMSDPDMGAWSYAYDAAGNLITQTNALNQVLWFKYDNLDRPIEKRQTGGSGPLLARYWYDQAGHGAGIGRRTTMTDTTGSATWAYDTRGRVTSESKTISGGGTFVTQWTGYDAMDRVTAMRYPGGSGGQAGEQVSYGYTLQGLNSVAGSQTYVQSTAYDAAGRVTQRVLGSGTLQTNYTYYPWTTPNGLGRLQRIQTSSSLQDMNNLNPLLADVRRDGERMPRRNASHQAARRDGGERLHVCLRLQRKYDAAQQRRVHAGLRCGEPPDERERRSDGQFCV